MKNTGKPIAITMAIGPAGDSNYVATGECAVRLARAGNSVNLSAVRFVQLTRPLPTGL